MNYQIKRICCIGAGYVGGPTMAVIADKCRDIEIYVVDTNKKRIQEWNNKELNKLPIYEPGLSEIIKRRRGKNLHFTNDIEINIEKADMIFISVNTPTKTKGIGAGKASDLSFIESSARQIAKFSKSHTIIVEKSTLPVRTADTIKKILSSTQREFNDEKSFDILSNPEFLAEGNAINDLCSPDRVLIGGECKKAIDALKRIYLNWIEESKIITTNLWSSELSKLASNAFLAQRISSINSLSALCEASGASIEEVKNAVGSDTRIGSKFLDAGPGFGGSCFKKDILNLVYLCEFYGLNKVSNYWNSILEINNWQKIRILNIINQKLFGNITGKKIAIFGFAFKANTNDTRESPAIELCKGLLNEGANLRIFDPKVKSFQIEKDLDNNEFKQISENYNCKGSWKTSKSLYDAADGADAIVIITEWNVFNEINWEKISTIMRKPSWIFDTRSTKKIIDASLYGLNIWRLGNG